MSNANTKQTTNAIVHEAVHTDSELYKVGAVLTSAFAVGIGVWAVICLSSAFMSEGPITMVKGLIGAATGTM